MYRQLAHTAIKQGNYEVADIVIQRFFFFFPEFFSHFLFSSHFDISEKSKRIPFSYIDTHVRHIWKSAMAKFGGMRLSS
jgi:hypothetical protein